MQVTGMSYGCTTPSVTSANYVCHNTWRIRSACKPQPELGFYDAQFRVMFSSHVEQEGEWVLNLFAVVVVNVAVTATAPAVSTQLVIVVFVFCECLCAGTFKHCMWCGNAWPYKHTQTHTQTHTQLGQITWLRDLCAGSINADVTVLSALKISKDMKI